MNGLAHLLVLIGLDLVLLAGWVAVPLGLGGNFILLGTAILTAVLTKFAAVGWTALLVMAAGVALGEILEAGLGSLMARKYGASRWGMLGAFVGTLVGGLAGTAILPVVGSILGAFAGAALGATGAEWLRGSGAGPGLRAGFGAFLGRVLATGVKMAIGMAMVVYLVIRTHR